MKTEQEQLIAMLTRIGAEPEVRVQADGRTTVMMENFSLINDAETDGYMGFYTIWHFDKDGDLFAVANWE